MRHVFLMATLLLTASAGARAEIVDIRWATDGRFAHKSSVAAGKFVELCGKLPAGLKVRWDFEASSALDFNVHYHEGKAVVFPAKLAATAAAQDTLRTLIEQDYCWMWSNKSAAPATLSVNLQRLTLVQRLASKARMMPTHAGSAAASHCAAVAAVTSFSLNPNTAPAARSAASGCARSSARAPFCDSHNAAVNTGLLSPARFSGTS